MQKTTLYCDGCGTAVGVVAYKIYLGRDMDASGNGYETNWDYKDYCESCHEDAVGKHGENIRPRSFFSKP